MCYEGKEKWLLKIDNDEKPEILLVYHVIHTKICVKNSFLNKVLNATVKCISAIKFNAECGNL